MILKNNSITDLIYSIPFVFIILVNKEGENGFETKLNDELSAIFTNIILIGILLLWMKSISQGNGGKILAASSKTNNNILQAWLILFDSVKLKIAVLLAGFTIKSFYLGRYEFNEIHIFLAQIFFIGFYTLAIVVILQAYLKLGVHSWGCILTCYLPFFVFLIVSELIHSKNIFLFLVIPCNFQLALGQLNVSSGISIYLFIANLFFSLILGYFYLSGLNKLAKDHKIWNLPLSRLN